MCFSLAARFLSDYTKCFTPKESLMLGHNKYHNVAMGEISSDYWEIRRFIKLNHISITYA
ncbi:hypothetical protein NSTC745_04414 [Nostoc sp. DSM 114161]|jgi:hypothetical protein